MELGGVSTGNVSDSVLKKFLGQRAGEILRKEDATLTSIFQELKFDSGIPDACDRIAD
jgi:hypothetical protein